MAYSGNAMYESDKEKYLSSLFNWGSYNFFSPSEYKAMMDFDQGLTILGVIFVIISFIIMLIGVKQQSEGRKMVTKNDKEKAIYILNERYAKGEISKEQYESMKEDMGHESSMENREEKIKIGSTLKINNNYRLIIIVLSIMAVASVGLAFSAFFSGYNNENNYNFQSDDYNNALDIPSIPTYHSVVIEVTGSADSISLSYTLDDTSNSFDYARLPWSRSTSFAEEGEWYYVYAQNNGEYGWIEATLTIDGIVVEKDTSYRSYGVVSVGKYV
jgi:putative membrane protein